MNTRNKRVVFAAAAVLLCVATVVAAKPKSQDIYRKIQLFATVLSLVERYYVEPVDDDALLEGAVSGMVRTLDPHSALMPPEEFALLEADTRGEFGGVGLEVGVKDERITVITPMPDSPAARAGILPGDRLVAVDGEDATGMGIEEAVRRMRGKVGTAVEASFVRLGEERPFAVTLVREVIHVRSVLADLPLSGYAWIRVRMFQDGTAAEIKSALRRLERKAGVLSGLVLDMRGNPGGVLDEAVRSADLFVRDGIIVTTRGRGDGTLETYRAHRLGTITELPLVVIVDETSASAAEIVAGALQDSGRALVVGRRSFGKGSVQSILPLMDGYGLKLTIARYFTPSGRSIQAEGIAPDLVVDATPPEGNDSPGPAFSEANLPGSLRAVSAAQDGATPDLSPIEDYPLRTALQIVRGLARKRADR